MTSQEDLAALVARVAQLERWERAIRGELFNKQLDLLDDPSKRIAAHPGRRAGKSEFIPRAACRYALDTGFNEVILIGAETLKKAIALHWSNINALVRRYRLPLKWDGQASAWKAPWGASIRFWGFADKGALELLRGFKARAALFDEVASYAAILPRLADSIVGPALEDTGGPLYLLGTPSFTRAGPWFEICDGRTPGWSVHHWDVRQNARFPRDPHEMLRDVLARNKWDGTEATFLREYLGLFVNDDSSLVYRWGERNDAERLPDDYDRTTWVHTIGVDFGMTNECAWVVLASHPHRTEIYVVEAFKQIGLLPEQAAVITARLCERYNPDRLVGDAGGLGKPYVESFNRRYGVREEGGRLIGWHMLAADKAEKRAHIDLLNGDIRAGRLRAVSASCQDLLSEVRTLPWSDEFRTKEHAGYPNHCTDALLYAWKHHAAYLHEAPEPSPRNRDPNEADRWREQQEAEALRRARETAEWETWS